MDADGDGTVTLSEFEAWWIGRSTLTESAPAAAAPAPAKAASASAVTSPSAVSAVVTGVSVSPRQSVAVQSPLALAEPSQSSQPPTPLFGDVQALKVAQLSVQLSNSNINSVAVRPWRCLRKSQIRAGPSMESEKCGVVEAGTEVLPLEFIGNRMRFDGGWVSLIASTGDTVFQAVDDDTSKSTRSDSVVLPQFSRFRDASASKASGLSLAAEKLAAASKGTGKATGLLDVRVAAKKAPKASEVIEAIAADRPDLQTVSFAGNTIYNMKAKEYTSKLVQALVNNTHGD
eukprot:SAG31_NODE_513_length_14715_cov_22.844554_1_plen_288_part_10